MFTLTDQEIEHYNDQGYVVVPSVFSGTELSDLDETIRGLTREAIESDEIEKVMELEPDLIDGEPIPRRIYNPFEQHEAFRALATDNRVLDRIECQNGPDIGLQHSK